MTILAVCTDKEFELDMIVRTMLSISLEIDDNEERNTA